MNVLKLIIIGLQLTIVSNVLQAQTPPSLPLSYKITKNLTKELIIQGNNCFPSSHLIANYWIKNTNLQAKILIVYNTGTKKFSTDNYGKILVPFEGHAIALLELNKTTWIFDPAGNSWTDAKLKINEIENEFAKTKIYRNIVRNINNNIDTKTRFEIVSVTPKWEIKEIGDTLLFFSKNNNLWIYTKGKGTLKIGKTIEISGKMTN
jgi:hypothetical protein